MRIDVKVIKAKLASIKTNNELSKISVIDAEIEKVIAQSDQYKKGFLEANADKNELLL